MKTKTIAAFALVVLVALPGAASAGSKPITRSNAPRIGAAGSPPPPPSRPIQEPQAEVEHRATVRACQATAQALRESNKITRIEERRVDWNCGVD